MIFNYKSLAICALTCFAPFGKNGLSAQALPIALDGNYSDWTPAAVSVDDPGTTGNGLDLVRMAVANDENYLFIQLQIGEELVLTDNNDLTLFLDGDNNPLTGKAVNGIGAELELRLGDREGIFYFGNSTWFLDLEDVAFHNLPNFSSTVFEMAIGREVLPDNLHPLFTGNEIKVLFQNGTSGDKMPNQGETFSYLFDNDPTPAYTPIELPKEAENHLRIMTWNTLSDGLLDNERKPHFQRVIAALQPDIVTFNECWDMTAGQAATFLNQTIPLGNFQSWNAVKLEAGNITLSRFPLIQNWNIYPGHRLMASLIDLPDAVYDQDFLVVNGHLRCCAANSDRQLEADAFAKFVLDATSTGGSIDLAKGTPFVLSGDMNLVGWQQQYNTLLTGQIVNTNTYGLGGPLDWDGTDLLDVVALQTDLRMAYTWRKAGSQYPPSRLDYHICSNSVLNVEKSFSLQTEMMPPARLSAFGLEQYDTGEASDHFPKVTDFSIKALTATGAVHQPEILVHVTPNPSSTFVSVGWMNPWPGEVHFRLKNLQGQLLQLWKSNHAAGYQTEVVNIENLPQGMYLLEMRLLGAVLTTAFIKS